MDVSRLVGLGIHIVGRDVADIPDAPEILQIVQGIVGIHQGGLGVGLRLVEIVAGIEAVWDLLQGTTPEKGGRSRK